MQVLTQMRQEVLDEMIPYFIDKFGNPSTIYYYGREAKAALEDSREKIAQLINADPMEIFLHLEELNLTIGHYAGYSRK